MSKDELKDKVIPHVKTLYDWIKSVKEIATLLIFIYGAYSFASDKFTKVENHLDRIEAAARYVDTDKIEHIELFETCQRSDARFDSLVLKMSELQGMELATEDAVIEIKHELASVKN